MTLFASALAFAACKSPAPEDADGSLVRDFDDDADDDVFVPTLFPFHFCPDATSFNIVNAYWAAVTSSMVYGKRAPIEQGLARLQEHMDAQARFVATADERLRGLSRIVNYNTALVVIRSASATIIAFRGTQMRQVNDYITDLELQLVPFHPELGNLGSVHKGFHGALDIVWDDLGPILTELQKEARPIFFTGHSLGGALATLAVAKILVDPAYAKTNLAGLIRGIYTFGTPRVGDTMFSAALYRLIHEKIGEIPVARFRNSTDIVSQMPPMQPVAGLPVYANFGDLYYFDAVGQLFARQATDESRMLAMPIDVSASIPENLGGTGAPIGDLKRTNDHSLPKYIAKLEPYYAADYYWSMRRGIDPCKPSFFQDKWASRPDVMAREVPTKYSVFAAARLPLTPQAVAVAKEQRLKRVFCERGVGIATNVCLEYGARARNPGGGVAIHCQTLEGKEYWCCNGSTGTGAMMPTDDAPCYTDLKDPSTKTLLSHDL
jgi:hypothetical protein